MDAMIWGLVRDERTSLARLAASLSDEQWATRSLCTEWTVGEVFAHLVMTPARVPGAWPMATALVAAHGHLWTAGAAVVHEYARDRTQQEVVESLSRLADARTRPVFVVDANILPDLVVHGQDVAVPLGLERSVPDAAARVALDRLWSMGWPFHARRRLAGVRLRCLPAGSTAADTEARPVWEAGEGPEVSGSAGALALLMTGRTTAAAPMLAGRGAAGLTARRVP